jgi:GT2 family glycosyltransferase
MKISVLVVSFNVQQYLRECLSSLQDTPDVDVVVVDNASGDGSAAMVRRAFPRVRLVAQDRNTGFSAAVNTAARLADGDAFLLLNPDARLPPGALQAMALSLRERADAWALGFRQVDEEGVFQLSFGFRPTLPAELFRRVLQVNLDRGASRLARALDLITQRAVAVPWVSGSALLVWRDAFVRVGGFDERFFLYFEDFDFCLRLGQAGGRIYYDPAVTVVHHRGACAKTAESAARRAYRQSQLMFWEKHRGPWMRALVHGYLRVRGMAPLLSSPP